MSVLEIEEWAGPKPGFIDRIIEAESEVEDDPTNYNAYIRLARIYSESMVYTLKAIECYENAISKGRDIEMSREAARFCMSRASRAIFNTEEKIKIVSAAIKHLYEIADSDNHNHGEDLTCYNLMAKLYAKLGDKQNAERFRKMANPESGDKVIIKE